MSHSSESELVALRIGEFSKESKNTASVHLSNELVGLLSDQLYQSPLKAIEELVVNAYDADASECRLQVPAPSDLEAKNQPHILVFDDGEGMDEVGLVDLWHVGHSAKREDNERRSNRKVIGKFGIGKLATHAVSNRLTYISRTDGGKILGVTIDFRDFKSSTGGATSAIPLPILEIDRWGDLRKIPRLAAALKVAGVGESALKGKHWTIVLMEELKPKAAEIRLGRLKWVVSTAMPLKTDFSVFLNGTEIKSSKEKDEAIVSFTVNDLPLQRIETLSQLTGLEWSRKGKALVCSEFPTGIKAAVIVTERSLYGHKSEDIARSHGYFVRVNGRLINQEDPSFGVIPKTYEIWNSFRADVDADDLDEVITANREEIKTSLKKRHLEKVLNELFNEARVRFNEVQDKKAEIEKRKIESERDFVAPRLVEQPLADMLSSPLGRLAAIDESEWFYLRLGKVSEGAVSELVDSLYNKPRASFTFRTEHLGQSERLVRFDLTTSTFTLNEDHEFVLEHGEDPRSRILLEDVVTAEVMLEVYLRRAGLSGHVVGDVLGTRDLLLRSLAKDRRFSLQALGGALRDAAADERDLELALVAAMRGLGFVASHISGAKEPDGLAKFVDYPDGEMRVILEAKSSADVPSLGAIDFAGLQSHMKNKKYQANGCLLLAPAYPGSTKADNEAAQRARNLKISCWTIEQLAMVVEAAEARHISARTILDIVKSAFAPEDVAKMVDQLLSAPKWRHDELYSSILDVLRDLEGTAKDAPRNESMVLGRLSAQKAFAAVTLQEVRDALGQIASSSKGAITFRPESGAIIVHSTWDELERRVAGLTRRAGRPRKPGRFNRA